MIHSAGIFFYKCRKVESARNIFILHRIIPVKVDFLFPDWLTNSIKVTCSVQFIILQELIYVSFVNLINLNNYAGKIFSFNWENSPLCCRKNYIAVHKPNRRNVPLIRKCYRIGLCKINAVRAFNSFF